MLREVIQNADDLKAGCVRFDLPSLEERGQLVIVHNAHLFTHPLAQTIPIMEVPLRDPRDLLFGVFLRGACRQPDTCGACYHTRHGGNLGRQHRPCCHPWRCSAHNDLLPVTLSKA